MLANKFSTRQSRLNPLNRSTSVTVVRGLGAGFGALLCSVALASEPRGEGPEPRTQDEAPIVLEEVGVRSEVAILPELLGGSGADVNDDAMAESDAPTPPPVIRGADKIEAGISTQFIAEEPIKQDSSPAKETPTPPANQAAPKEESLTRTPPSKPPVPKKSATTARAKENSAPSEELSATESTEAKETAEKSKAVDAARASQLQRLEEKLAQLSQQQEKLLEQNKELLERVAESEARMGELFFGDVARPDGTRGSMAPTVTLVLSFPSQGPRAETSMRFDIDGGTSITLVGTETRKLVVPNTGRIPYRVDGDANGFPRMLTWNPQKAADSDDFPLPLPLSLEQQQNQ